MDFIRRHIALITALIALGLSGCQVLGFQPLPNPYENADTMAEKSIVTIKSFGAAQESLLVTCGDVEVDTAEAGICVTLISTEQVLRPAVLAAARVGAEYGDINARIEAAGPEAPAEWLVVAAQSAGDLAAAYDPIKTDLEDFIGQVQGLVE